MCTHTPTPTSTHTPPTLVLQPGDVDQGPVLDAAHQAVEPLLAGLEAGLRAGRAAQLPEPVAVPGAAQHQPHHHVQQRPAQANALLRLPMAATGGGV